MRDRNHRLSKTFAGHVLSTGCSRTGEQFRRNAYRRLGLPALCTAALLIAASADAQDTALEAVNCTPLGQIRGDADRGADLHHRHCAECHGPDGRGESMVHMETPPKDQSDPIYMKTLPDEFLYLAICKGGEEVERSFIMPAWGDVLSDQDIKDLVAYVRTFSGT